MFLFTLLILEASLSVPPAAPVRFYLSEPAKSTKWNLEHLIFSSCMSISFSFFFPHNKMNVKKFKMIEPMQIFWTCIMLWAGFSNLNSLFFKSLKSLFFVYFKSFKFHFMLLSFRLLRKIANDCETIRSSFVWRTRVCFELRCWVIQ